MSHIQRLIDTLEGERAELQERPAWSKSRSRSPTGTAAEQRRQRQLARGAARPLGERALGVRTRRETKTSIVEFLA